MARMTKEDREALIEKIKELCDLEDGLTAWEVNFVEDVSHKMVGDLTPKQIETITELYNEHCD